MDFSLAQSVPKVEESWNRYKLCNCFCFDCESRFDLKYILAIKLTPDVLTSKTFNDLQSNTMFSQKPKVPIWNNRRPTHMRLSGTGGLKFYFNKFKPKFLSFMPAKLDGSVVIKTVAHAGLIYDLDWSPDSSRIALCSADKTATIWKAPSCGQKYLC